MTSMSSSNPRGNGELDSCTDVPTDSLVTITDAYIEQGISLCPDREVFHCNVTSVEKLLGERSKSIFPASKFFAHLFFLPGVIEVSSADECNSRCAQENKCLFTSFVKMINGAKERCYLFEHGSKVLFKRVQGNVDNIKDGKVFIFSSKLQSDSGIEALGLQVSLCFKNLEGEKLF